MDRDGAKAAVRELLLALDQDVDSNGLKDTPDRVADMFVAQCTCEDAELDRVFEIKFGEMVLVKDIPFSSFCQHHLVPYFGRGHIAYIPNKMTLGISKLARLIYSKSKGFTTQEQVTTDIAETLMAEVEPKGCMVVIEATHCCMNFRGARAVGATTTTSAVRGLFLHVEAARSECLTLILKGSPR